MYESVFFCLLSASVCVYVVAAYAATATMEIRYKKAIEVIHTDYKDFYYDVGEYVAITCIYSHVKGYKAQKNLTLYNEYDTVIHYQTGFDSLVFQSILTESFNNNILVCDIETNEDNQTKTKTLKVHFVKNLSEFEKNVQSSGNLFKIILISLGAFIATSIVFMIIVSIYSRIKRKSRNNNTQYPEYFEIIPMEKTIDNTETSKEENAANANLQDGGILNNGLSKNEDFVVKHET